MSSVKQTKMPKPLFDEAQAHSSNRIVSGKYIGNCPKCRLVLAAFDPVNVSLQVKCPRCDAKSAVADLPRGNEVAANGAAA